MAEANLCVQEVGKLLVHYKLGKPNAVRIPNSCNGIKTIEKYLKANKARRDLRANRLFRRGGADGQRLQQRARLAADKDQRVLARLKLETFGIDFIVG